MLRLGLGELLFEGDPSRIERLPGEVARFAALFDQGAYPDLVEVA